MINFEYLLPTKVIFGKDTHKNVGETLKNYGAKKVLFHYGGGSIKRFGVYDDVVKSLNEANIEFVELGGVEPNPELSLVYKGIDICKDKNIDFILAVGGGSVIDSAKAIGAGAMDFDVDVWDYFNGKAITSMLPLGVVLTIPAAGSETSNSVVISKKDEQLKRANGSEAIRPTFAILNPELTYTLPKYQTACGVVDILAHIMERYFTSTEGTDLSDRMSEAIMQTVIQYAQVVLKESENYNARAQIMWAGSLAHNNILGVDKEQDWSSHRLEHEISAIYDIAHGAGLAIMFPAWMKFVYKSNINKFAQFAVNVWGVPVNNGDMEVTALEGIRRMTEFFKSIDMPTSMSDADINDPDCKLMAEKIQTGPDGLLGGFVMLDMNDRKKIFDMAK